MKKFDHKGLTVNILTDEDPENPLHNSLCTMVCFHRRFDLGNAGHGYSMDDLSTWAELKTQIMKDQRPAVLKPLYLFDHSGITISHNPEPFRQCDPQGWDWGQIGFAYMSRDVSLEAFGGQRLSLKKIKKALSVLNDEVEIYNQFLQGEVYGYVIEDAEGRNVDSCWGYYSMNEARADAIEAAEYNAKKETV